MMIPARIISPRLKLLLSWKSFLLILLFIYGCGQNNGPISDEHHSADLPLPEEGASHFINVTDASGINFVHTTGDDSLSNLIESVGGGAAFLDYNQDGYLDIYITNGSFHEQFSAGNKPKTLPKNALYENLGNGRFKDVTDKAKVGDTGYGMGVTVGDFDNNGYPDIYVSNHGPNVLFKNNGNGTFSNVTKEAEVAGNESSVGAVWLDYDNDGWLDLYVGNYVEYDPDYNLYYAPDGFPGPMNFDGQPDVLYHNMGNGKFEDVTEQMGIFNPAGRAMGVGSVDYDDDGFADIYVANDHMVNYLYHNEGGNGFKDVAVRAGVAFNQVGEATTSMAVNFADYNGDGLIDLFVSDDSYSSLYQNEGGGLFNDVSYPAGIAIASGQFVGWSSSFLDFDNDMDVDIIKINGELQHLYGQEDQLFENTGDGKFRDASTEQGPYFHEELVGRGACFGDYDNDGDLDAFIVNLDSKPVLLRNDIGNKKNWLLIKLVGNRSNKDGIGTKVKVITGDKMQVDHKKSGGGYLSQNDPRLHFGLGTYETIDQLEIIWPSGSTQSFQHVNANQILTIEEQ